MRFELPDNAREAFQFLALGVAAVLVLRVAFALVQMAGGGGTMETLAEATLPYRDGYPLLADNVITVEGMQTLPRVATGFLFAIAGGVALAVLAIPISMVVRWNAARAAVIGGRVGLVLCGAWSLWCLLAFPVKYTEVNDEGLVLHESSAFMGAIPLPFMHNDEQVPWNEVQGTAVGSRMMSVPCWTVREVNAIIRNEPVVIASDERAYRDCAEALARQRTAAYRLNDLLKKRVLEAGQR